jgi:putative oxidoreductase
MFRRQVFIECIAALLIMLFLYASLSKFLDFKTFTGEMNNQPLPNSWTPFLVWFIPCTEIAISLALMIERTRLWGFYASTVLMGLFTVYTIIILFHYFSYIPCSCGGVIKRLTWKQHLVFNLFFVALSIRGAILQRRKSYHSLFITNKKNSYV